MLVESLVGVMALIAATVLHPGDYFAINSTPEAFQALGMATVDLPQLAAAVGMDLEGRTGGAVTLAVGMASIFAGVEWFSHLTRYFYQFVIMFEAVFILTAIDAGTRTARYLIQDFLGNVYKPLKKTDWLPGTIFASALACVIWGYLLNSGDIASVWALFGVSNQLMASIGLACGVTYVLKVADKRIYALTCFIPLVYLYITVNVAGFWMVKNVYWNSAAGGFNILNGILSCIMLALGIVIIIASAMKWKQQWQDPRFVKTTV